MSPAAQGRHCAACAKVVIDFTQKTDAEILALLQRTAAPCGRFRADQLGRSLLAPAQPAPRWRVWLAAAATVLGLRTALPASAVAQRQLAQHQSTPPVAPLQIHNTPLSLPRGAVEVRGQVHHNGRGLVAQIVTSNSSTTTTAPDGSFVLSLSTEEANTNILVLTISSIGYTTHQVAILLDGSLAPMGINLAPLIQEQPVILLGGIASTPVRIVERRITAFDLENAVRMATSRNP